MFHQDNGSVPLELHDPIMLSHIPWNQNFVRLLPYRFPILPAENINRSHHLSLIAQPNNSHTHSHYKTFSDVYLSGLSICELFIPMQEPTENEDSLHTLTRWAIITSRSHILLVHACGTHSPNTFTYTSPPFYSRTQRTTAHPHAHVCSLLALL